MHNPHLQVWGRGGGVMGSTPSLRGQIGFDSLLLPIFKLMVITYTRGSAHTEYKGKDWVAYSWIDIIKDTLICWELKKVVENNTDVTFDELYELLKNTYKNKKVKSRIVQLMAEH